MARQFGEPVRGWEAPPYPADLKLKGRYVALAPLFAQKHAEELFSSFKQDKENKIWDYLPYGPFNTLTEFSAWIKSVETSPDPYFLAIKQLDSNKICGVASYLRIKPNDGSIEVGHINYSPQLQNTTAATEAMYLMMKWAFDNGYRRYEWKCDALNIKSRKAAQRLGLSFEGVFRQATIYKDRNRDTAWFATINKEWPDLKKCFQIYLNPVNFNANGTQKTSLRILTKNLLFKKDPASNNIPD
ncbi:MAG: GNAT family N-acetyltransferase [Alphaproteobacteria bacterium]